MFLWPFIPQLKLVGPSEISWIWLVLGFRKARQQTGAQSIFKLIQLCTIENEILKRNQKILKIAICAPASCYKCSDVSLMQGNLSDFLHWNKNELLLSLLITFTFFFFSKQLLLFHIRVWCSMRGIKEDSADNKTSGLGSPPTLPI